MLDDTPVDTTPVSVETPVNPSMEDRLGPRRLPPLLLGLRTLASLGAGLVGAGVIFAIALVGGGILQSALGGGTSDALNPLFVFVFMAMIFLGSATSNLLGPLFMALTDREHYPRVSTTLTQIFVANLVILVVMAPVYMLVTGLNVSLVSSVAGLQVVVSAFVSAMILEILSDSRYALVGVYGTAFAVLVSAGFYLLVYSLELQQPLILLLLALPVMWVSIGLFGGLMIFVYGLIYKMYGVDFLNGATLYGADEAWVPPEETQAEELAQVERSLDTGASFLEKQK